MSTHPHPPKWMLRLMERHCRPFLWEGIEGDLLESYDYHTKTSGKWKADLYFFGQAIGFVRWQFLKKHRKPQNMKSIWNHYLLTSWRSLLRHKSFFAINLFGLVLGITCSLYAFIFIRDEMQFDQDQKATEHTYRLYKRYINTTEGVDVLTAETSGMMGPTMTEEYPEVRSFSRVLPWFDEELVSYGEKNLVVGDIYFADSSFFDLFEFTFTAGDPMEALVTPSSIVLTNSLATRIFDDENPMGKSLEVLGNTFVVTGIVQDPPRQSSFRFSSLISWTSTVPGMGPLSFNWMNNWLAQATFTFVKLAPGADPAALIDKLPDMMNRHFEERADQYFLRLQPFRDIYLYSDEITSNRGMDVGSIKYIFILGISALLILIIASINYINISLSRTTQNRREVGVRKVMGSTRTQLMGRFVSESLISVVLAAVIGLILLAALLPQLSILTGKDIPGTVLFDPIVVLSLLDFAGVISVVVGFYPAYIQSRAPVSMILQQYRSNLGFTGWFRRGLLTLQYGISAALIAIALVIYLQTSFMKNKPLGFEKDNVLVMELNQEMREKAEVLETELTQHPNIESISVTRTAIGGGSYTTTTIPEGYQGNLNTRIFGTDPEFFETYQLEMAAGRSFLAGSTADSANFIVNEAFVEMAGWDDPVGKRIKFSPDDTGFPVVGVVRDFHYFAVSNQKIEPLIMYLNVHQLRNATVRIGRGDVAETLAYMEQVWSTLATKSPFNYYFVDDWHQGLYQKEEQMFQTSITYSIISILLCLLGLYGLTALMLQERLKEISIRKVLGADVLSLVGLINKRFFLVIMAGLLIAIPSAWYFARNWLEQFAYRIEMPVWAYVAAAAGTFLVSFAVVSILAARAGNTNPAETLSQE